MITFQRRDLLSHMRSHLLQPMSSSNVGRSHSQRCSTVTDFVFVSLSVLSCASTPGDQIRVIVNDAPVPLSPLKYCPDETKYGLCPVDGFVDSLKEIIQETDFAWGCRGDYNLTDGDAWQTVNGTPPAKPANFSLQARDSVPRENKRWEWPIAY